MSKRCAVPIQALSRALSLRRCGLLSELVPAHLLGNPERNLAAAGPVTLSQRLKRIGGWIGFAILLAAIVLIAVYPPGRVAKAGAGLRAHNLCSAV